MRVHIFASVLEAPDKLKSYFERRSLFFVGRFAPKIERIDAERIDVNLRARRRRTSSTGG